MTISAENYDGGLGEFLMTNSSNTCRHKKHPQETEDLRSSNDLDDCDDTSSLTSGLESTYSYNSSSLLSASTRSTVSSLGSTSSSLRSSRSSSKQSRRRERERTKPTEEIVFDPTLVPSKSCLKNNLCSSRSKRQTHGTTIKIYLPGNPEPVAKHRTINFNEQVSVREVRSAKSLLRNKAQYLWFQPHEHAEIKHGIQKILNAVNAEGTSITNGRKYCVRGLERFRNPDECFLQRAKASEAVVMEQYLQRAEGNFDPAEISAVYIAASKPSQRLASRRGIKDAIIAESILGTRFRTLVGGGGFSMSSSLSPVNSPTSTSRKSFSARESRTSRDLSLPPSPESSRKSLSMRMSRSKSNGRASQSPSSTRKEKPRQKRKTKRSTTGTVSGCRPPLKGETPSYLPSYLVISN